MSVTNFKLSSVVVSLQSGWAQRLPAQRPPLLLWFSAVIVAILALLPLSYLFIRTAEAGFSKTWDILLRPRTLEIFWGSAGLALGVTLASVVIGVLLAWLTVRTDL